MGVLRKLEKDAGENLVTYFRVIFLMCVLLLCSACQQSSDPKFLDGILDVGQCNSSCTVDSDCVVLTEYCFLQAANQSDAQCFWDAYQKFTPTLKSMKCAQPRLASDYNAVCLLNQCTAEENFETSPNVSSEAPRQGIEITLPSIDISEIVEPPALNQALILNLELDDILWAKRNDETGLHIKLAPKPTQHLNQLTSDNRGKRLRITLGHLLLSEAVIGANIDSGMIVVPRPSGAVLIELEVKLRRTHDLKEFQTSEHPPLYTNSRWQFSDYNHPPIEELGPDYASGDKPYMTFSFRRGTMHGHDGTLFFRRLYEFDNKSITFKPDPKFCQDGACFDTLHKFPSSKNKWPQTRFLGRYNMTYDDRSLTLENTHERIDLERYQEPPPLPPLPKDLALCKIRDLSPQDDFSDHDRSYIEETGYKIFGSQETLYWDHHIGTQGYVELGDGQDVLFEGPDGPKVLRKLTPYGTSASFGVKGLFCTSASDDRIWPNAMMADAFDLIDIPTKTTTTIVTDMIDTYHCLQFEDENGERFTPVFSETGRIGYDDFGIYVVDPVTGAKLRGGDYFRLKLQTRPVDPEAYKFGRPCHNGPLLLVEP